MSRVLSTKLAVDEANRFKAAAQQQGLSKSSLLKHLVKEYLGDGNEESKTSTNCKLRNSSSSEKKQTPEEVRCQINKKPCKTEIWGNITATVIKPARFQMAHSVYPRIEHPRISNTAINSQGKASLAKVLDSKETITIAPFVEQGLLKVEAKTQAKPKVGFGELLFFGLAALGIVLARKRNSNQKILPEPNYRGYPDYNEDIAAAYRDMGIPYNL